MLGKQYIGVGKQGTPMYEDHAYLTLTKHSILKMSVLLAESRITYLTQGLLNR